VLIAQRPPVAGETVRDSHGGSPHRRGVLGVLALPFEAQVLGEALAGGEDAEIGPVTAQRRLEDLLGGLVGLTDNVGSVFHPSAGHADVDITVAAVYVDEAPTDVLGQRLHPVGATKVGKLSTVAHIARRQGDLAPVRV